MQILPCSGCGDRQPERLESLALFIDVAVRALHGGFEIRAGPDTLIRQGHVRLPNMKLSELWEQPCGREYSLMIAHADTATVMMWATKGLMGPEGNLGESRDQAEEKYPRL